jgi:outer membrane protein
MKKLVRMSVLLAVVALVFFMPRPAAAQNAPPQAPPPAPPPGQPQMLTLADAEKIALANHPQIQTAQNLALAAKQQVREARSSYYPQANGSLTGAAAMPDSRIAAGALNNPIIYDRESNGLLVGQLLTDFGRTHELVKSSDLHAQAQQEGVVTSQQDVLLQVDQAYFGVLKAQAVLQVAEETVKQRQLVSDQITAMAKSLLKSDLDVSFANVDLSQAQLLLIQAQNDVQASFANLSTALGYADQRTFTLAEIPVPPAPPADLPGLIQQALQNRPELVGQRLDVNSAQTYATAERDLYFPTVSAVAAAGLTPAHQTQLDDRYAAAGVNVNIPIFNGHLYGALHSEATFRAQAEQQRLRDLQDSIVRDVRTAWLNSNAGFQRLSVTEQLLSEATMAMNLAQARYNLGLSSIVELTQAQLNLTQAQISETSAKFDYETETSLLNYQIGNLH